MRKLTTVLLGCILLGASAVPAHAQKKERLIEQEKRQTAIRQKEARKAEEEEAQQEGLRLKVEKVKKTRALAADQGEDTTDLNEEIEALKREAADPETE